MALLRYSHDLSVKSREISTNQYSKQVSVKWKLEFLWTEANVYLLYCVGIAVFTLDVGLLARSQYSEDPVTGHLDTGFSWFPCA